MEVCKPLIVFAKLANVIVTYSQHSCTLPPIGKLLFYLTLQKLLSVIVVTFLARKTKIKMSIP